MKVCCKDFKELIEHIDEYPSLVYNMNVDDDGNIEFGLAFYQEYYIGKSWHYLKYCPFCAKEVS